MSRGSECYGIQPGMIVQLNTKQNQSPWTASDCSYRELYASCVLFFDMHAGWRRCRSWGLTILETRAQYYNLYFDIGCRRSFLSFGRQCCHVLRLLAGCLRFASLPIPFAERNVSARELSSTCAFRQVANSKSWLTPGVQDFWTALLRSIECVST